MGVRGQYEHLDSRDATDADVLGYLREHSLYITEAGGVAMDPEQFWRPGDLVRYWQARDAWAPDAPPRCALPDLPTLLRSVAGPASTPRVTFMANLELLWSNYAAWMATEGRDPANPTETARQRAARRARESMALSRERRRGTEDPERAELLRLDRELYDAYMAECRRRTEETKVLDAAVREAHVAYQAVHARVKG